MNKHYYNYSSGEFQHECPISSGMMQNEYSPDMAYNSNFDCFTYSDSLPNNTTYMSDYSSVTPTSGSSHCSLQTLSASPLGGKQPVTEHYFERLNSSYGTESTVTASSSDHDSTANVPTIVPAALVSTSASHQTQSTLQWLEINFHERESVSISRSTIYDLYVRFCELNFFTSVCKATFGKLIRSKFTNVKSKRLGARGQSKYHYYNISFRDSQKRCFMRLDSGGQFEHHSQPIMTSSSSELCSTINNGQSGDVQNYQYKTFADSTENGMRNMKSIHMRENSAQQMLTIFSTKPADNDFTTFNLNGSDYHGVIQEMLSFMKVPLNEPLTERKSVFINLYRIHCQCLIDAILSSNFAQIRHYFIHFWKQLPLSLIDMDSMRALDYKMLELLERLFLSNVDNIDWTQVINVNTMLQLIPDWLQVLLETESFNNTFEDNYNNNVPVDLGPIFETKLQFSQSISARFKAKVDFVLILERLSTIDMQPICSYLQGLSSRVRFQSLLFDNASECIPQTFVELLSTQYEHEQTVTTSFKRHLIDSLDKFFLKLHTRTHTSVRMVCSRILVFFSHLNRLILDDSLMENCDEFEDVTSEEEFEMMLQEDTVTDTGSEDSIEYTLQNNARLFLFVIENYCFEICQNTNQKCMLQNQIQQTEQM